MPRIIFALLLTFALVSPLQAQQAAPTGDQLQTKLQTLTGATGITVAGLAAADVGQSFTVGTDARAAYAIPISPNATAMNIAVPVTGLEMRALMPFAENDPLGQASFDEAVLILAEQDNAAAIAGWPRSVRDALAKAAPQGLGATLALKRGLNVVALATLDAGGIAGFLHANLGHEARPIPVVGTLAPGAAIGVLGGTGNIAKSAWYGGLALQGPVGTLKPPGFPSEFVQWPSLATMALKGVNGNLSASVDSSATLHFAGQTLSYDVTFKGDWNAQNQSTQTLDGKLEGTAIPAFGSVQITGLELEGAAGDNGWSFKFVGKAEIGTKALDAVIDYAHAGFGNADFTVSVAGGLNLADLVPGADNIPGLSSITVENAAFSRTHIEATLATDNHTYQLFVHPKGSAANDGTLAVIMADELNLGDALPSAGATLLKDMDIMAPVLVLETSNAAQALDLQAIPMAIADAIRKVAGDVNSVQVQPGLNVYATLEVQSSSAASTFSQLGITEAVPLSGSLDPRTLAHLVTHARGGSAISAVSNLNISAALPRLTLPGLPDGSTIKSPRLTIQSGNDGIKVAVGAEFDMDISGTGAVFAGEIDISAQSSGERDFTFKGSSSGGWPAPFALHWLRVDKLDAEISSTAGTGTARNFAFALDGTTTIGSAANLPIKIALGVTGGKIASGKFDVGAAIGISDIPALSHLAAVKNIKLAALSIEMEGAGNDRKLIMSGALADLSAISFEGLTLQTAAFKAEETGTDWQFAIDATGTLRGKQAAVSATLDTSDRSQKDFTITITGDHSIGDLIGVGAGPFDALKVEEIKIANNLVEAKVAIKDQTFDFAAFVLADGKPRVYSVSATAVDLAAALPGGAGSVLAGAQLADAALVVVRQGSEAKGVTAAGLPGTLAKAVGDVGGATVDLKTGVNVFAALDISRSQGASDALGALGIGQRLPLMGTIDPGAIVRALGQADAQASNVPSFADLNLGATIPTLTIPGIPGGTTFTNTRLAITRTQVQGQADTKVAIGTDAALKIGDDSVRISGEFDISKHGSASAITFTGSAPGGFGSPLGVSWLHIEDLSVHLELASAGAGQARSLSMNFDGKADLGRSDDIEVTVAMLLAQGTVQGADIKFTGSMPMSDLPPLSSLPRADAVTLDGFELATRLDGTNRTNTITATVSAGQLVDVPGFAITSASLNATEGTDGWDAKIDGSATLNSKTVQVSAEVAKAAGAAKPDFQVTITDDLTVAELLGSSQNIPGLSAVSITKVTLNGSSAGAEMDIGDEVVDVLFYRPAADGGTYMALALSNFNVGDHIPGLGQTVLSDVSIDDVALVYSAAKAATNGVKSADMPEIVAAKIGDVAGAAIDLKPGLNMFAKVDVNAGQAFGELMSALGVKDGIPLTGTVDPRAVLKQAKNVSSSQVKAWLSTLDLTAPIPNISLPGLPSGSGFANNSLRIDGGGQSGTVEVGIATELTLKIGDNTLDFQGLFDIAPHNGGDDITFQGKSTKQWHAPFGISWVALDELDLSVKRTAGTGGGNADIDFTVGAKTDIGDVKNLSVAVAFDVQDGKLTEGEIKVDGKVKVADIPGLKGIPHADKYELDELIISNKGFAAVTEIDSAKFDVAIVQGTSGGHTSWSLLIDRKGGTLASLLPFKTGPLLEKMKIDSLLFVLSEGGLDVGGQAGVSDVAKSILQPMVDLHPTGFTIQSGIAIAAIFDPAGHPDGAKAFSKLGLSQGTFIMGEIGGLFGGPPSIDVKAFLPSFGEPHGLPKFLRWGADVTPAFFIYLSEEELAVGLEVDMNVKAHTDTLTFETKLEIEINEEGPSFDIVGKMAGTWENAMGIKGFALENVALKCGISAIEAVTLGFDGTTMIGSEKVEIAAEVISELDALGVPTAIAFKGSINRLGPVEIVQLFESLAQIKNQVSAKDIPFFEIHDLLLAFATPGAEDPDLDLKSSGFAAKGALYFMGQNLGSIQADISPETGVKMAGAISDLHLGPISLYNNNFDLNIGLTSLPELAINANAKILGAQSDLALDIKVPSELKFEITEKFGELGSAHLLVDGVGFDVTTGKASNADFLVDGELDHADFFGWLDGTVKKHVDDVLNEVNAGFKAAEKALDSAQKKVDGLSKQIESERAKVRAERNRTEDKLRAAEDKVNDLKKKADDAHSQRDHCHWYQVSCKVKYEAEYLSYSAARDVAEGVLHAVEKAVEVIPVDLDPRVVGLIAEKDTATVALKTAKLAVEGADVIDKVAEKVFNAVVDGLNNVKPIVINEIKFQGSLGGAIKSGEPWLLYMDYAIFRDEFKNDFVFKLDDPKYDVEQIGFVAFQVVNKVIQDGLKDLPKPVRDAFAEAIGKRLNSIQATIDREFAKYQNKFKSVSNRETDQQKLVATYDKEREEELQELIGTALDAEPDSLTFSNKLLEVGHSGLCLNVKNGGQAVDQQVCNDRVASERWHTHPIKDGYVYIVGDNKCLKPINNNPDLAVKLVLDSCDANQPAQYWKVNSHDGDFYTIANRATEKCMHFEDPNATPGAAEGAWYPCHGLDAQAFRELGDTKPVYHHVNIELVSLRGRLCVGRPPKQGRTGNEILDTFFAREKDGIAAANCSGIEPRLNTPQLSGFKFNYVEDVRGDLKIVDSAGNCIFPRSDRPGDILISKPCDHSDDQFWQKAEVEGGFQLRNLHTKFCFDVGPVPGQFGFVAHQANCNNAVGSSQFLSFGLPAPVTAWWQVTVPEAITAVRQADQTKTPPNGVFSAGRYDKATRKWQEIVFVCQAKTSSGTFTGTIGTDGTCDIATDGSHAVKVPAYELLKSIKNAVWVTSSGTQVPIDAPPLGSLGKNPVYACRAIDKDVVVAGWAYSGECFYNNGRIGGATTSFQYLASE